MFWTLTEYWLHRVVFHFEPDHRLGRRFHFMIHGVHHDHPNDRLRLVMPPSASIPLAALFLRAVPASLPDGGCAGVRGRFPGRLPGLRHAALLRAPPRPAARASGKMLRELHMRHHFQDHERGFGVSAPYWDRVFRTAPHSAANPMRPPSRHAGARESPPDRDTALGEEEIVDALPVAVPPTSRVHRARAAAGLVPGAAGGGAGRDDASSRARPRLAIVHAGARQGPLRKRKKSKAAIGEIVGQQRLPRRRSPAAPDCRAHGPAARSVPPWPFRLGGGSAGTGLVRPGRGAAPLRSPRRVSGSSRRRARSTSASLQAAPRLACCSRPAPRREGRPPRRSRACGSRSVSTTTSREFHERFRRDALIGRAVRARARAARPAPRPSPWEALVWAVTEQLIEFERAVRDPAPADRARSAAAAPRRGCATPPSARAPWPAPGARAARLASFDLRSQRGRSRCGAPLGPREMRREGRRRPVPAGDLDDQPRPRRDRRPLRADPRIGPWTVEMLGAGGPRALRPRARRRPRLSSSWSGGCLTGQPACARADTPDGARLLRAATGSGRGSPGRVPAPRRHARTGAAERQRRTRPAGRAPRRAGTRWSAPRPAAAAA